MGLIYCARCRINDKLYVGQTTTSLDFRRQCHISQARRLAVMRFHHAINKYGVDAFEWAVLYDDLEDWELDIYERMAIRRLGSLFPDGYNMENGGTNGRRRAIPMSEEQKRKIGAANKIALSGKKQSPETIERRIASLRGRKRGPHTDEAKQKMSDALQQKWQDPEFVIKMKKRPVYSMPRVTVDVSRVVELYRQGLSLAAISDLFQCDQSVISNRLRKAGEPIRCRGWEGYWKRRELYAK